LFTGTIEDNIRFGKPSASQEEIENAVEAAGAKEFIQSLPLGYQTIITQDATNLSGGQKQRITIARAFLKDSPILLLDEPTSSLDSESTQVITEVLNRLKGNKTCLIIAHQTHALFQTDVIYEVKNGALQVKL
jgi:ABC-type bacteriocin/lantibiotic exporter with double-glycine peptidase domain